MPVPSEKERRENIGLLRQFIAVVIGILLLIFIGLAVGEQKSNDIAPEVACDSAVEGDCSYE